MILSNVNVLIAIILDYNFKNMKRKIKKHLVSFREKRLNKHSKTLFKNLRICSLFILLILIISCSVQNEINKDGYKSIPTNFSVSFFDKPDTIRVHYDNSIRVRSLVKDFTDMGNIDFSKPVQMNIKKNELFLKFEDNNKKEYVLKFYGKRYKRKFVFYTNYETVSFPVVFMRKEMTKYSVFMPDNQSVVFVNSNVNEGMFLFFGAGSSLGYDYKFKLLKNE